jgi:hypothetical protein
VADLVAGVWDLSVGRRPAGVLGGGVRNLTFIKLVRKPIGGVDRVEGVAEVVRGWGRRR